MPCDCGGLYLPRLAKTIKRENGKRLVVIQYKCDSCANLSTNQKWEEELTPEEVAVWEQKKFSKQ
jgi:hypothetical protein